MMDMSSQLLVPFAFFAGLIVGFGSMWFYHVAVTWRPSS
jgi:hypothetical protein